jgi:L-ribulose-5-phosphate 4-epimerase
MIWSIIRRLVFRHFRHFRRTHAAIYSSDKGVNAVVHIHSIELWNELIYKVPTTNPSMDYGTIGLAKDILRLFKESDVYEKRIIVMAGDRAGILSFGNDMDEAVNVLMEYLKK